MTLNSNDCSLLFWHWDDPTQAYQQSQVKYVGNQQRACLWLTVNNNKVVTDKGGTFISLTSNNTVNSYMVVDDTGVLRLIGIIAATVGLPATDF